MSTKTDPRIVDLEARVTVLHSRLMRLERLNGVAEPVSPPPPRPVAAQPTPPARPEPARQRTTPRPPARPAPAARRVELPDIEELLGGRVLAWVGGLAVVLGMAFFFALAVSRGWIGEEARVLLAAAGSLALLGSGVWLRERRGRIEASMATAATGLAGLFLTIVVATQVYDLIPSLAGLALALVVGAAGSVLALRWNAPVIGGIGTLGGVLSPALAGADASATTVALLWIATAAGAAVLVHKRWDLLGISLFVASAPQWLPWTVGSASPAQALVALVAFGTAGLVAAIGLELHSGAPRLRHSAAFLMAANSLVIAVAGAIAFGNSDHPDMAKLWLVGLALVHAATGATMRLEHRLSPALRTLCIGIAVVLADVAWGEIVSGPGVGIGWALSAIGFAFAMSRRNLERVERQGAVLGLGGQIAITIIRILAEDAPLDRAAGAASVDAIVALVTLAAACLVSGRFAEDGHDNVRIALDAVGLAVVAYLTLFTLDGALSVAALASEACVLAMVAKSRGDRVAAIAALGFLGIAALHTMIVEAPPRAFLYGAEDVVAMVVALGAVALATLRIAGTMSPEWTLRARTGASIAVLYAASLAIVTGFQPGEGASTLLDLGVRQEGQMLVSALWGVTGLATLVIGLGRSRELRLAGLAVLIASIAKVFLFDLATLTSIYRVGSLIALGLLLLGAAYAWQRSRPAPLPDLRGA